MALFVVGGIVGLIVGGIIALIVWSQANQRNAKLERHLDEVHQSNEHLSSEREIERGDNANRKKELKTASERIVNLESDLAQAHRSNKHLANELGQESKKNKDLSEQKAKLESDLKTKGDSAQAKLVVPGCSAYRTLLDAIYSARGVKTDKEKQEYLKKLQKVAIQLWGEFTGKISPDYSRLDYQEAYLLCYFLPYSQPVPYLLNRLILKGFSCSLPENGVLNASFFGCGPGPELFGLMRYLGGPESGIKISATMLDRCSWEHGRKIVFKHLLPEFYDVCEFTSDLVGNAKDFLPTSSEQRVSNSDLIVMQHCLNERDNVKQEQLMKNMNQLVEKMKSGAVMLIIERAGFPDVSELLVEFIGELVKEFDAGVDIAIDGFGDGITKDGVKIKPILDVIPTELATDLFMKIPIRAVDSVKFIWMAISKK